MGYQILHVLHVASLYPKKRSPFWWISFVDVNGIRQDKSTGLRVDSVKESAEARLYCAQISAQEGVNLSKPTQRTGWDWAGPWINSRRKSPRTQQIYFNRWEWVCRFLRDRRILGPEQIKFDHAEEYIEWRTTLKKRSGKTVGRNTAIFEVKLLAMVMARAAQKGLVPSNPLTHMGLSKDPPPEKPEITDEEFSTILPLLDHEPDWMRNAFLIAMHTGCRLRETRIPLRCIDLTRKTITFPTPKGGESRAFSIPLPPALVPMFTAMKEAKRTHTLDFPFQPSRQFQHFFRRAGLPHLCFHCLRVTFVSRLARAHVPLSIAMALVNHANETIHRIYQRLSVNDLRDYSSQLFQSLGTAAIPVATPSPAMPQTSAGTRIHSELENPQPGSTPIPSGSQSPEQPPSPSR